MRCPSCGADNLNAVGPCWKCGKSLVPFERVKKTATTPSKPPPAVTGMPAKAQEVDHRDIPKRMKFDYDHTLKDMSGRTIEGIHALMQHLDKPQVDVEKLMQDAANLINRQFGIMNVGIGLKGVDGLFRYDVLVGFRDDVIKARKSVAYKKDEFYDEDPYKGYWLSKYTKIYLAEDHPYADEEEKSYNRPILLSSKRKAISEALEGDYIDTHIFDEKNELIGWIEISGTRTAQLPDIATIRWLEIIGSIIAAAVRIRRSR